MAGTAHMPWQTPVSELNEQLTPRYQKRGRLPTVEDTRATFRLHQIPATITMFDGEGDDFAILALTQNGWHIRIPVSDRQCLDLARNLLAKVRAR
jgi:hypothetical protein